MVDLNEYRTYFGQLCPELGIGKMVMVVQEEHLRKKLPGLNGTILALVYPSGSGCGEQDNVADVNTCLLFVLENSNKSDSDPDQEFTCYSRLLQIASGIKKRIIEDSGGNHPLFTELDMQSFQIDPEWNIAGSYVGYSIVFGFKC